MTIVRTIAELLVRNLVELVMLSVGLRARPAQVLAFVRRPQFLARELFVLVIGVPLLTLLVVRFLPIPPWTAIVIVLFGISPTAPLLLHGYRRREAIEDKALAVVVVALASSIVVVPLWLALLNRFGGFDLRMSAAEVVGMLAWKIFVPLVVGALLLRLVPKVARHLERVLVVVIPLALVGTVALLVYLGAGSLSRISVPILVALVVLAVGTVLIGEAAGGRDPELREVLGRVAMNGNPAIALAIIGASYPDRELGGLVAAYVVCRGIAMMPYVVLTRVRAGRRARVDARGEHDAGASAGTA